MATMVPLICFPESGDIRLDSEVAVLVAALDEPNVTPVTPEAVIVAALAEPEVVDVLFFIVVSQ